ncbi:MAG: electron transfer flavoprotein subunit alpha [Euryarchaeota archaeon]|nr:electron transfer flavoprotein subunit alpha [Euryarchaeota archaeon]|tara:strand:+ start:637 stop:1554 length:918 start_codon:yes stop_codon:yes gene_type:complete
MDITIIAETNDDGLHPVTSQMVAAAAALGSSPTVLCPGGIATDSAASIDGVGAVIGVEGDCFSSFDGGSWSTALNSAISGGTVFAAATPNGREIAARLAAARDIPVIQDATGVSSGLTISRPIYSGKAMEKVNVSGDCILTIRPNAFSPSGSGGSASVSTVNHSSDVHVTVMEAIAKASERLDVSEANIVIAGGRGMGNIDNWSQLESVADQIGAAVGASRAVVDEWGLSHSIQVGQTGKVVTPTLYIAVGISGAIQHLAGMRSSKYIVAINKDADAPIFGVADYGVVANWEDALPVLKEALSSL